jgi:hypothetical protein
VVRPNSKVRLPKLDYRDAVEEFAAHELAQRDQQDMFVNSG